MSKGNFILSVIKNRLIWAALLLPLLIQLIFFFILLPALKDGNDGINNLRIAIVNKDTQSGMHIAQNMTSNLPFDMVAYDSLDTALDDMNKAEVNAVFYISDTFTSSLASGMAEIKYYVNQATSTLTKQLIETVAKTVNSEINRIVFDKKMEAVKTGISNFLSSGKLPDEAVSAIGTQLGGAISSIKYNSVIGTVVKVNESDGFTQMFISMFVYIAFFLSATSLTVVSGFAMKKYKDIWSKWALLLGRIGIILVSACLTPFALMIVNACFGVNIVIGEAQFWLLLFTGLLTFTLFIQMFYYLFGLKGLPPTILILLPLQITTCALMLPKEILPPVYLFIRQALPSTYFSSGMLHAIFGGASVNDDIINMLLMCAATLLVTVLATALKWRKKKSEMPLPQKE